MDLSKVDTLVFGGAGSLARSVLQILSRLEHSKHLDMSQVKSYAGTSSGAMIAVGLCCGFSVGDVIRLHGDIIERKCFDAGYVERLLNWYRGYGALSFDKLVDVMIEYCLTLSKSLLNKQTTFKQLYLETQKDLFLTGTNLTELRCEIFSHYTTPDMPVLDAMVISMSAIPWFGCVHRNGKTYIDGGFTQLYPMKIFLEPATIFEQFDDRTKYNCDYVNLNNPQSDNEKIFPEYKYGYVYQNSILKKPEQLFGILVNSYRSIETNSTQNMLYALCSLASVSSFTSASEEALSRSVIINNRNLDRFDVTPEGLAQFKTLGDETFDKWFAPRS